ncbi:hypothetical protein IE53DRAFT_46401 [Violaceomyces palustris]|uniref:Uncharacterized protein n=1 Tax=Violaceomyces palustris TaxID=1673888 RepID=A0ACD0P0L7_9BASI|nr:hypothetical protein IE53DRAFT_46401 [Violaceomyces palustris]
MGKSPLLQMALCSLQTFVGKGLTEVQWRKKVFHSIIFWIRFSFLFYFPPKKNHLLQTHLARPDSAPQSSLAPPIHSKDPRPFFVVPFHFFFFLSTADFSLGKEEDDVRTKSTTKLSCGVSRSIAGWYPIHW